MNKLSSKARDRMRKSRAARAKYVRDSWNPKKERKRRIEAWKD